MSTINFEEIQREIDGIQIDCDRCHKPAQVHPAKCTKHGCVVDRWRGLLCPDCLGLTGACKVCGTDGLKYVPV